MSIVLRGVPARLGLPGVAAGLALLAALLLAALVTPRWQQEAERAMRERPAPPRPAAVLPEPVLPAGGEPAARVADLLALALRHGVKVERTSQRVGGEVAVQRLQLALHAGGRYADVRNFIAAALQADPALVLDRLQMHRPGPTAGELEADLQWSLLHTNAPEKRR